MNRGTYAYVVVWVEYALRKSSHISNITLGEAVCFCQQNNRFRDPMHFQTNRFTSEKIPSRLHCCILTDTSLLFCHENRQCMYTV